MYAATKTATAVCSSAFAFGLPYDIVKAAKGDTQAFQAVASYFKTAPLSMGTMLAHHDIFAGERAGDQFRGDIAAYKLTAAPFLLLPGTPLIHHGEEIGMAGAAGDGDAPLRAPMSWAGQITGFSAGSAFRRCRPTQPRTTLLSSKATRPRS